jgi:hypothetical protein
LRGGQGSDPLLGERHLDVQARREGAHRIAESPDEVRHDEPFESPLLAENIGEQVRFCPHHSPFTELYALITLATPASTTARK